jgi:hypothetical protein
MRKHYWMLVLLIASVPLAMSQPIGDFDDTIEIYRTDELLSLVDYAGGVYSIDTLGGAIGYRTTEDEFTFVYKEMTGNFAIETIPIPLSNDGFGGVMVRQELTTDAVFCSLLLAGDSAARGTNSDAYSVFPTFRSAKGGATKSDGDPEPGGLTDNHDGKIRIERFGNTYRMYTFTPAGSPVLIRTEVVPMKDPVYVGLAVTADGTSGYFEFEETAMDEYPFSVERSIPVDTFTPGSTLNQITVTAKARSGSFSTEILETPPVGASFSNVNASAGEAVVTPDGAIRWTLTSQSGEATLTYDVALGGQASIAWQGTYDDAGTVNFIGGDAVLPKYPTLATEMTTVEIDPLFPTVFEAEIGVPSENALWGLMTDPRVPSGITAVSMNTTASHVMQYEINIPVAGTYYLFGSVRGEDGNSDSFHFEMDGLPAGTDATRWNINNSKAYVLEWVEQEDPNNDPRPFDLTAGVHTIFLGNREDDASIDFFVVTNDPNLDLATVDLNAQALVSRAIENPFPGPSSASVSVTLKAGVTGNGVLHESLSDGFVATNINTTGGTASSNADGSITWDVSGQGGKQVIMTYDIQAPTPSGPMGIYGNIEGTLTVGNDAPLVVGGDTLVGVPGIPGPSSGKTVFFFQNVPDEELGDTILKAEIGNIFGVDFVLFDDGNEPGFEMPVTLDGADLAHISGSVGSGALANMNYHFNDEETILSTESYLFDDFAFQPDVGRGGTTGTEIEIVDNTHPITEGFDLGLVQVYKEEGGMGHLASVPDGLRVLATVPGNPDIALLWVVEKGATINGTTSPGIRTNFFGGIPDLTPEGRQLFNQVVAFSLGLDAPEPPVSVEDFMLY